MDLVEALMGVLEREKCAVLVVSLQNDYCDKEGKLIKVRNLDNTPIEEMVDKLNPFLDDARSKKVPVVWTRQTENRKKVPDNFRFKMDLLGGDVLDLTAPGTWGWEFYRTNPGDGEKIFDHNQPDPFSNEKLEEYLKNLKVETLVITGVYTSRSVDTATRSAARLGYNVMIPEDLVAMARQQEQEHYSALTILNTLFAEVVESGFIKRVWEGETPKKPPTLFRKLMGVR